MTIYLNGKEIDVEEGDELKVEAATPAETTEDEEVETTETKETLGSKIKNLPTWKKLAAGAAAVAGGLWLKGKLTSTDDEDEEDENEDEE